MLPPYTLAPLPPARGCRPAHVDIDSEDRDDPMACTTYVNDIFEYLRESEVRCAGRLRHLFVLLRLLPVMLIRDTSVPPVPVDPGCFSAVPVGKQVRHFLFASPASHVDPGYIGATSSR